MELRNFTQSDWDSYSGAESINPDRPPVTAQHDSGGETPVEAATIVIGGNAVYIDWHFLTGWYEPHRDYPVPPEPEYEYKAFLKEYSGGFTPFMAIALVETWSRIPTPAELLFLGFAQVSG